MEDPPRRAPELHTYPITNGHKAYQATMASDKRDAWLEGDLERLLVLSIHRILATVVPDSQNPHHVSRG